MDDQSLKDYRRAAADASFGTSCHAVYKKFEYLISSLVLSGDLLDFGAGKGVLTLRLLSLKNFNPITAVRYYATP